MEKILTNRNETEVAGWNRRREKETNNIVRNGEKFM
jgi:hypothetical protein